MLLSSSLLLVVPLVITLQYEREQYSVEEEDGSVTLALVLDRAVAFPVTVTVRTLDLLNSSVGDAATGELLEVCMSRNSWRLDLSILISSCLHRTNIVTM